MGVCRVIYLQLLWLIVLKVTCLHVGVGAEAFLVKALVHNTDDKIKGLIIHPSKVIFGSTVERL